MNEKLTSGELFVRFWQRSFSVGAALAPFVAAGLIFDLVGWNSHIPMAMGVFAPLCLPWIWRHSSSPLSYTLGSILVFTLGLSAVGSLMEGTSLEQPLRLVSAVLVLSWVFFPFVALMEPTREVPSR